MLKKHGLLGFLGAMGLFGSFVTDGDGAGSDGDNFEFDDEFDDADGAGAGDDNADGDDKNSKRIEELERKLDEQEQEKSYNNHLADLKKTHKDFDENQIKDYLVELHKTDPAKAESLNSPLGWENIHLNNFAKKEVENDHPNFGRNVTPVSRTDEFEDKLKSGQALSLDEQTKYFS